MVVVRLSEATTLTKDSVLTLLASFVSSLIIMMVQSTPTCSASGISSSSGSGGGSGSSCGSSSSSRSSSSSSSCRGRGSSSSQGIYRVLLVHVINESPQTTIYPQATPKLQPQLSSYTTRPNGPHTHHDYQKMQFYF